MIPERRAVLAATLLAAVSAVVPARAADRRWQAGRWGPVLPPAHGVRTFAIEADAMRLECEDTVSADQPSLTAEPGAPVTFAVARHTVYVRVSQTVEHKLRLVKTVAAPQRASPSPPHYAALGGGHLIQSVGGNGRFVTLEDASVWEILPEQQFKAAEWQPGARMTVRTTEGQDGFDFELVNTDSDEGVLARFVRTR